MIKVLALLSELRGAVQKLSSVKSTDGGGGGVNPVSSMAIVFFRISLILRIFSLWNFSLQ